MDTIDFIMMVEDGEFDHENEEHVQALQDMIDSGMVWKLQGFWGRFATQMINLGIVKARA